MANAFALPATPRPAVIFTEILLHKLKPDEVDAIYAHELGHLEHMDSKFIKKNFLLNLALVTMALLIVPILETWAGLTLTAWKTLLIGAALGLAHVKIFGHNQEDESDSDARAVQLCGNAEALQTGLERIHDINHVPHR